MLDIYNDCAVSPNKIKNAWKNGKIILCNLFNRNFICLAIYCLKF